MLAALSDSAVLPELPPGRPAMTTDAFVVDPPVFPGGDLGYLAVCGTVNDLVVAGARPLWLSFAVILEEGCPGTLLETIATGAANAAREAGVEIVAGDTKVVPKGKGDLAYAVTSGLGVIPPGREFGDQRIAAGDAILASGPIGDHGATIMACRHKMAGPGLRSDCAPLSSLVFAVVDARVDVHAMHDPTRGGLAVTCNEVAGRVGLRMMLEEAAVPVRPEVGAICELLGLDPLYVACEGRVILWVAPHDAERALQILRAHPQGRDAVRIGTVSAEKTGTAPVLMRTRIGGERPVDLLSGMDLPRIC
jgi:hydrogenase expression/formation protein HypE